MNTDTLLDDCCNQLGYIGFNRLTRVLSILLDVPQNDIRVRLSAEGRLVQSGLIETNLRSSARNHVSDLLGFNNKDLLFSVRHHQGSAIGLFQSAFRPAPDSLLCADDFTHLSVPLNIARPYLQQVLEEKKLGVNILIYGPPGTGKSQLTRMLANELCAELYEIACTDNNGDPIDRRGRLCALRSAMCVLGQQKTLLVLDEIEDLFSGSSELAMLAGQERQKGWINRMLEENPIPCFWLTNNIHALDNAYIRRFDLVLRLENPPRRQRENLIRSASHNQLSQPLIDKLADHEQLMPAIITRAMSVASIQDQTNAANLDTTVEFLVNATLQAQGFPRLGQGRMHALPTFYSPELANTDMPLDQLLSGLRNYGEARLCFYGPPGTGKTAFGHWLAQQLGKPLLTRRASDLISPYVGMTEQNFARAFEQANDDDAILLLDEVDTLRLVEGSIRPLIPAFMLKTLEPRFNLARQKLEAMSEENPSARWLDKVASVQPELTQIPPEINADLLDVIQQALMNDTQLSCRYYSAHKNQYHNFTLNPLGLVQRAHTTYLIASADPFDDIRQFVVHRFEDARGLPTQCFKPEGFDLQDYVDSGAMQFGTHEKIKLEAWISAGLARLLQEAPISHDMLLVTEDEGSRLTATVNDSWELKWWILSHAGSIQIQQPQGLRDEIQQRLRAALELHEQAPNS